VWRPPGGTARQNQDTFTVAPWGLTLVKLSDGHTTAVLRPLHSGEPLRSLRRSFAAASFGRAPAVASYLSAVLRVRAIYLAQAVATMVVGLSVLLWGDMFGATMRDVLGDALWASMMTWLVSAAVPTARAWVRGVSAYAICAAVEVSQLIHTPGLDAIRETMFGQLVLGSGYDPRDFAAYAFGCAVAAGLSKKLVERVAP
jgi:hypothetical protein